MDKNIGARNAVIESATITKGDRGFLDCWLQLNYGSCGSQGFGGYVLYLPNDFDKHNILSVAGHHIFRIMEVAGVDSWDCVVGRTIRAKISDGWIVAIGHIVNDDWFCPKEDYKDLGQYN